ncbi:hypothetical protein NDU88_001746 [Pleurodeles waltl]|uniref:Uncharacterized protein n=1 Tax=Pleurodeles waltl TaxID=8319 RepID=A0AAV7LZH4_PLEWA|nr:hypothetical protein NDU88_001746 [Pleurodeles waltl]
MMRRQHIQGARVQYLLRPASVILHPSEAPRQQGDDQLQGLPPLNNATPLRRFRLFRLSAERVDMMLRPVAGSFETG